MMTSVAAHWTVFLVIIVCSKGVHSLTVKVSPIIFTDLKATNLTLPCEYVLEKPDHTCNIRWEKSGDVVIVKDTAGQTFVGHRYRNRVLWGDECSLILLYPTLNDTGRYTITVFATYDMSYPKSAYTKVTVGPEVNSSRGTTTGVYPVTSASQSIDPDTIAAEDGFTSPVLGPSVPVTAIAVIILLVHVVLMWWTERYRFTDTKHRLLLGGIIVVFTVGIIAGTAGIVLRSSFVTTVGQCFFCLGFVSDIFCVFWIIKTKACISRESGGKLFNHRVSRENKPTPTANMENDRYPPEESKIRLSLDSVESNNINFRTQPLIGKT